MPSLAPIFKRRLRAASWVLSLMLLVFIACAYLASYWISWVGYLGMYTETHLTQQPTMNLASHGYSGTVGIGRGQVAVMFGPSNGATIPTPPGPTTTRNIIYRGWKKSTPAEYPFESYRTTFMQRAGFYFESHFSFSNPSGPAGRATSEENRIVGTPLWPLLLILGFLSWRLAPRKSLTTGLCPHCRYDLRATQSSTCPECGKPLTITPAST
jgi:hypothetical protein